MTPEWVINGIIGIGMVGAGYWGKQFQSYFFPTKAEREQSMEHADKVFNNLDKLETKMKDYMDHKLEEQRKDMSLLLMDRELEHVKEKKALYARLDEEISLKEKWRNQVEKLEERVRQLENKN